MGSGKANIKCTTSNTSSGSGLSPSKWQEVWSGLKMFFWGIGIYITLAVNALLENTLEISQKKIFGKKSENAFENFGKFFRRNT